MKNDELKAKCDISRIQERIVDEPGFYWKGDMIVDLDGNYILSVSPLQFKMIEKILDNDARIKTLEDAKEG